MEENKNNNEALEKLRELFSDYEDLEMELYQLYESQLNSFGIKLGFYFPSNIQLDYADFFQKYDLWTIFKGSIHLYDIFYTALRMQMTRPWLLSRDYFNIEISIGNEKIIIPNSKNGIPNCMDLQTLLSQVKLFYSYPDSANLADHDAANFVKEFKSNKHFVISLVRTKKEPSVRQYLEKENYINNSDDYRSFLEKTLQTRVVDILDNADMSEETIRMHLQTRLALWGFRFSKILTTEEIIQQFSIVKAGQIFPSLLDARLFIDSLSYNSNSQVIDSIKSNNYKAFLNKFLSRLENQKILLLKYNGNNLENQPEFVLSIKT